MERLIIAALEPSVLVSPGFSATIEPAGPANNHGSAKPPTIDVVKSTEMNSLLS